MSARVVGIVQARTGSTRLPGKVLADLGGSPLLTRVIERLQPAETLDELIVATSDLEADDPVAELANRTGVACFRGSERDVLDRFARAAAEHDAGIVVRLTGDNPVLDHTAVDATTRAFVDRGDTVDFASTVLSGTFPLGIAVEVFRRADLDAAAAETDDPVWREHVTPFFYKQPERFKIWAVANDCDQSHVRLTVDTREDLAFVRRIFDAFADHPFTWRDAVAAAEMHPDWLALNRDVRQRTT